jgi:hypothetical protein
LSLGEAKEIKNKIPGIVAVGTRAEMERLRYLLSSKQLQSSVTKIIMYREDFERALASENSVEKLREFAMRLHAEGRNRQEIYEIFFEFYQHLQNNEREMEENLLGDVMDMIMGTFAPFNLHFPDQPTGVKKD